MNTGRRILPGLMIAVMLVGMFIGIATNARAATVTSTASGGSWSTAGTWTPAAVPAAGDTVIIAGPVSVDVTITQTGPVTINSGGTLTATTTGTTITIGPLTINSGGILNTSRVLTVNGATDITGTINFQTTARADIFAGNITLNSGAVWNEAVAITPTITGSLTNNAATFTASTGAHTFNAAAAGSLSGTTVTAIPSATFTTNYTNSGTLTSSTLLTVTGASIRLTNNGTITATASLAGTGGVINGATGILNIGGTSGITTFTATAVGNTVNYTGAAQTVRATAYSNLTLSGSGAKTMATGLSVAGNLKIAPTGNPTANVTGTNLNVSSLTLGASNLGTAIGTWGSTASTPANSNNTYFGTTATGTLNVSTDTRTSQATVTLSGVPGTATVGGTFTAVAAGGSGTGTYSYAVTGTACTVNSSTGAGSVAHVSGGCSVTATRAADGNYLATASAASAISTINKANQATVTLSGVPGTATVGGTFTAVAGGGTIGAYSYAVTGTACTVNPSTGAGTVDHVSGGCSVTASRVGDSDYNVATSSASVITTINKANQATVTLSGVPGTATVGGTFTAVAGGGTIGAYSYAVTGTACTVNPSTGAGTVDLVSGGCSVTASRAGDSDYNVASSAASAITTIGKATPTITTPPTASGINFGQALSASTLSGGAGSVPGGFTFTTPGTIPPAIGNYTAAITFTPTDTTNYNSVSSTVTVAVGKATPTITTPPTASGINFGQALSASTLSGGAGSVPGGFTFTTPGTIPPAIGNYTAAITFTPTDTTNYNSVSSTVTVAVGKATPTITTPPTASGINFGQALSASTLSGGAGSVPGGFTFTTPGTIPPAIGNYTAAITFTPTDTTNYNSVSSTVTVAVGKATPTITTPPTASGINFGQALSASTLSGGAGSVPGGFTFTTPGTIPPAIGNYTAAITFTPTDTTNYNSVSSTVTVAVGKATPTITTPPTASGINFGQALSASTLSGGAGSVPGGFTFTTPGTIPPAIGNYTAAITFTPTDTTNYNSVSSTVTVAVGKATPTITTPPTASGINFGQALSASTLSGGAGSVPGGFTFTTPGTIPPAIGNYTAAITFTPTDTTNYNSVSSTVTVAVGKATPTITTPPTASGINFGQALSASTLSGGAGSVPGGFTFTTPGTIPPAIGNYTAAITFTPTDTTNYNSVSSTVTVAVGKATPTITTPPTASGINFGQALSASTLSGGAGSVPGGFTFTTPGTIPPAIGNYTAAITFTPTDTTNYNSVSSTVTVAVGKATPTITTPPTASGINFGQALSASTLSGGAGSVPGGFTFTTPGTIPPAIGNYTAAITFTPTDTTNYNSVSSTVTVAVGKATPTITTPPTASGINFGQALSASTLSGGAGSVPGGFTFTTPGTIPPAIGNYTAAITFTPTDTTNYNSVSSTVTVAVGKATPTITTPPTASGINFGQALSASTLSGGAGSVPGGFTFTTPGTIPPAIGNYTAAITFTPTDTTNYNSVSSTVTVAVGKATPTITTPPTASGINFGQALSASTLSGGAGSVPGGFTFTTPGTIPPAIGNYTAAITFTPTDTTNYNSVSSTVTVAVGKATPTITTPPTASGINFGQALSASTLSGGAGSVPGGFTFTTPGTIPPAIGNYTAAITFTPTDTTNYNSVSSTVTVAVGKATPTITTPPTASGINFGQALSASTLSGGAGSVPGGFTFTTPGTIPPAIGNYTAAITFTPTDTTNYNSVSSTVTVAVGKATPTITTPPTASGINFGQALSASTLSGGAGSVPGGFTFTTPGTIPPAIGNYTAAITFTPTDTTNYNSVSSTVTVAVGKATPTITTPPTASGINFGQALSASTLSGGAGSVPGGFTFTTPGTIPPAIGNYTAAITFTPTDTTNYNSVSSTVTVAVGKATPTITTPPTASGINFGQALSASTLSGGAGSVPGGFTFTTPGTIPPAIGNYTAAITFTPTDTTNYNSVSSTVTVAVGKATPTITTPPTASGINFGQALSASTLSGGAGSVPGGFTFTTPGTIPPAIGNYTAAITFTPTDTTNYNSVSSTVTVAVGKATPTITTPPTASGINFGQALSASTLSGGAGSVPGGFTFTTPGTIPPAIGNYTAAITFTPTDTTNYNSVSSTVTVAVGKATPTITTPPTASGINFGQALSASTLSGGAGSVPGGFTFTTPGTIPPAIGNYTAAITFTPTDTTNYNSVSSTVTVAVSSIAAVNGACGTANAGSYNIAPSINLCSTNGVNSSVSGSGPWSWTCGGVNGGSTATCSATIIPGVTSGQPSGSYAGTKTGATFTISRSEGGQAFTALLTGTSNTNFTDTTILKPNTVYQYVVTSDTDSTQTVFMTIRTALYNGWNIIGVPYNTSSILASTFFNKAVSAIYEWVPTGATAEGSTTQLGSYTTVSTLTPGKGYFVKAANTSTLLVSGTGTPGPSSATVTLKPGWTMIANPNTTNKTNIASTWLIDGNPLANAITSNLVGGSVYWWNGTTYDSWSISSVNPIIEPWKAYWIVNIDAVDHILTIQ